METRVQERIVDELIASAYEAATGNGDWDRFVTACGTAFPWSKTGFCLFDRGADHCTAYSSVNFDPEFMASFEAHSAGINPWIAMSEGNDWALKWSYESVSESQLKKTEFYADWVRPQDDISLGFAVNMKNDAERTFLIITNTFRPCDEPAATVQYAIMQRVRPHLIRAYELQRRLQGERALTRHLEAALARLGQAIAVVDAGCRVVFANRRAEAMFAARGPVRSGADGRLAMADAQDDAGVKGLIRRMANPSAVSDPPFVRLRHRGPGRFVALVAPLYEEGRDDGAVSLAARAPDRFILLVTDLRGANGDMTPALMHIYGLTPTEASLALAFHRGETLRDHAEARGVGYETVRKQFKSVQEKMDTPRQAELMRVLGALAGMSL